MKIAFFISSAGDSDLAKATARQLVEEEKADVYMVPLTPVAAERVDSLRVNSKGISVVGLEEIIDEKISPAKVISDRSLEQIHSFIKKNQIQHACIGVPSSDNEVPYQIALALDIPCTIADEYMFSPEKHKLWDYVPRLAVREDCHFAVPLEQAAQDIRKRNPSASIFPVGHLSLDRAGSAMPDKRKIQESKKTLSVGPDDELIFVSGTTQPMGVDNRFVDALLAELSTGNYPAIQLRMGLHPGVAQPDSYLQALLKVCEKYEGLHDQFKIILTDQMISKLKNPVPDSPYILSANISGPDAAMAAAKVTQAVPGALLNEAAFLGKPVWFHDPSTVSYLPEKWFSSSAAAFFKAKPTAAHSRDELGLKETVSSELAKVLIR